MSILLFSRIILGLAFFLCVANKWDDKYPGERSPGVPNWQAYATRIEQKEFWLNVGCVISVVLFFLTFVKW